MGVNVRHRADYAKHSSASDAANMWHGTEQEEAA